MGPDAVLAALLAACGPFVRFFKAGVFLTDRVPGNAAVLSRGGTDPAQALLIWATDEGGTTTLSVTVDDAKAMVEAVERAEGLSDILSIVAEEARAAERERIRELVQRQHDDIHNSWGSKMGSYQRERRETLRGVIEHAVGLPFIDDSAGHVNGGLYTTSEEEMAQRDQDIRRVERAECADAVAKVGRSIDSHTLRSIVAKCVAAIRGREPS